MKIDFFLRNMPMSQACAVNVAQTIYSLHGQQTGLEKEEYHVLQQLQKHLQELKPHVKQFTMQFIPLNGNLNTLDNSLAPAVKHVNNMLERSRLRLSLGSKTTVHAKQLIEVTFNVDMS